MTDHKKVTEWNRPCDSFQDDEETGFCVLCHWNKLTHEGEALRREAEKESRKVFVTVALTLHGSCAVELSVDKSPLDWKRRIMEDLSSKKFDLYKEAVKDIENQFPSLVVGHFSLIEIVE